MIVFYKEFKLPVTARIFSCLFFLVGIGMFLTGPEVGLAAGLPLVLICLVFWGLFIECSFDATSTILTFTTSLFGLNITKKSKQVKVNHLAMTRVLLKSKIGIGNAKGVQIGIDSHNYQYSLQLIFDDNKRELIESFADMKKMNEMAYELALQMQVKIFDATTTPQKWFDPLTGEEKIAEFKKRKR